MRKIFLLMCLVYSYGLADYFTEYIWYRAEHDMSRIVISAEHIRGRSAVDNFKLKRKYYESQNKFLTYDYTNRNKREFVKTENMHGLDIKIIITIYPPRGSGEGGAVADTFVKIFINGIKKLDIPLGYNHSSFKTIPSITIHTQDKSISAFSIDYQDTIYNFFDIKREHEVILFKDDKLISQ